MILAQVGDSLTPETLWGVWTFDVTLLGPLFAIVLIYGRTVSRLWSAGGRGTGIGVGRLVAFFFGVVALGVALVSPLDALSEVLFSAHMVQHLLLTLVAAPLLVAARIHVGLLPVIPLAVRRRGGRVIARVLRRSGGTVAVGVVAGYLLVLLVWHVPSMYDLAVSNRLVHSLEHVTLLLSGLAFWAVVAARSGPMAGAAAVATFVASLISVLLAATLTVATRPWYASHVSTAPLWGLSPLRDQVTAAAIMWVPGGIVYFFAGGAAVLRWIRADQRRLAIQRASRSRGRTPRSS